MTKLDGLRLFVQHTVSAASEQIFLRFVSVIHEYEREVLRLQQELNREKNLRAGPEPQDEPAEEEQQEEVRGRSCSLHTKLEEGGASRQREKIGSLLSNQIFSLREDVLGVKQEVEAAVSQQDSVQQVGVGGWSSSLQVKQEEEGGRASGPEDWLMDEGSSWSLLPPTPKRPEPGESADHDWDSIVRSESCTDDSGDDDNTRPEPGLHMAPDNPRLLVCDGCGREFSSRRTLRKHIRRNTTPGADGMLCAGSRVPLSKSPAKTFVCRICGGSFYTQGILLRHAENHCREPESRCGVCGAGLQSAEVLKEHLRVHREQGSTCDVCGKKCSSIKRMEIHRRVHTGEKPYSCHFCARGFSRKESLDRHLKVHSGDRPHRCHLCRRTFTRREYLVQHLKTAHTETPTQAPAHRSAPPPASLCEVIGLSSTAEEEALSQQQT